MINNKTEVYTAKEAFSKKLVDAIKEGAAKVEVNIILNRNGVEFYCRNFTFNDRYDLLHVGRFDNLEEFLKFVELFKIETADKEN